MPRIRDVISDISTAGAVLYYLFPGAVAAATAWIARMNDTPWHLVLFYGFGAMCFAAVAIATIGKQAQENSYSGKLKFGDFVVTGAAELEAGTHINSTLIIVNTSVLDLWVQLDKITYSLQNKTNANAPLNKGPFLVQAKTPLHFMLHSIDGINKNNPISGVLKLEISYGVNKAKLNRKILFDGTPRIGLALDAEGKIVAAQATLPINTIEYV